MGNNEENKPNNVLTEFAKAKNTSPKHMTGPQDLLSAIGGMSRQEPTPEKKKRFKIRWQQILVACGCILAIAAGVKAFLYLDDKIGAAAKEISTVEAQAAGVNTKGYAAITAEIKDLKAANAQLQAQLREIRDTVEMLKAKKNNVVAAPPKRR